MRTANRIKNILLTAGIFIITVSIAVWFFYEILPEYRYESTEYYTESLLNAMPECTDGIVEDCPDAGMTLYEVDDLDFAGILEMPDYNLMLPVYGRWEVSKLAAFPCLFSGSPDSRDLIIGSTSKSDLFPYVKRISVDDRIVFTNMTGVRFTYYVTDIRHSKSADKNALTRNKSDIVVFIKNRTAFEYVIISADAIGK